MLTGRKVEYYKEYIMNIFTSGHRMVLLFPVLSLLLTGGCMEIDITVEMHDKDGGATVTERILVKPKLLDAHSAQGLKKKLVSHLEKKTAIERMKKMGKGISLTSHEKKKLPDGSIQSVAVYTIPDINQLIIPNPFIAGRPAATRARFYCHRIKRKGKFLNVMQTGARLMHNRIVYPKEMVKKVHTPLECQILREMKPIIADMLSGFRIRLRMKIPTRYTYGEVRNFAAGPKVATLLSISENDLDRHGNKFFDNEEIMMALLQMDFDSPVIHKHIRHFVNNTSLPVVRKGQGFSIFPTSFHKQQYFQKKKPKKK